MDSSGISSLFSSLLSHHADDWNNRETETKTFFLVDGTHSVDPSGLCLKYLHDKVQFMSRVLNFATQATTWKKLL